MIVADDVEGLRAMEGTDHAAIVPCDDASPALTGARGADKIERQGET
jgi:hypothetical protein